MRSTSQGLGDGASGSRVALYAAIRRDACRDVEPRSATQARGRIPHHHGRTELRLAGTTKGPAEARLPPGPLPGHHRRLAPWRSGCPEEAAAHREADLRPPPGRTSRHRGVVLDGARVRRHPTPRDPDRKRVGNPPTRSSLKNTCRGGRPRSTSVRSRSGCAANWSPARCSVCDSPTPARPCTGSVHRPGRRRSSRVTFTPSMFWAGCRSGRSATTISRPPSRA